MENTVFVLASFSLCIMPSCFIHFVAYKRISFSLWLNDISLSVCAVFSLPTHLLTNSYFYLLALVTSASVNMGVHIALRDLDLISLG